MSPAVWVSVVLLLQAQGTDNDSTLAAADLPAYQTALASDRNESGIEVTFRRLWDAPAEYLGKKVKLEGRVQRIFRQGKVGALPPLVEAWLADKSNDLFCVVYPDESPAIPIGAWVSFSGVYLKRLRYAGGDVERLAPLLVGPSSPRVIEIQSPPVSGRDPNLDTMFGLIVGLIILGGIGRAFLRRPPRKLPLDVDPPPVFVDGDGGYN